MQGILELWLFNKTKLGKHLSDEKIRREVEKRPMFRYCVVKVYSGGDKDIQEISCYTFQ
jgi:hypothetical protein